MIEFKTNGKQIQAALRNSLQARKRHLPVR
jgi:hypothetical protein